MDHLCPRTNGDPPSRALHTAQVCVIIYFCEAYQLIIHHHRKSVIANGSTDRNISMAPWMPWSKYQEWRECHHYGRDYHQH